MNKLPDIHIGDFASKLIAQGKISTDTKIPKSPIQSLSEASVLPQAIAPDISQVIVPESFVEQIIESLKANRKAARKKSSSSERFDNPFPNSRETSFAMLDRAAQIRKDAKDARPDIKKRMVGKAMKTIALSKKRSQTDKLPEETLTKLTDLVEQAKALLKEMTTVGALGTTGSTDCTAGSGPKISFKQVKKNRCYKTPGRDKKKRTVEEIVREVLEAKLDKQTLAKTLKGIK